MTRLPTPSAPCTSPRWGLSPPGWSELGRRLVGRPSVERRSPGRRTAGPWAGALAAALLCGQPYVLDLAQRGQADVPALALVLWAGVLAAGAPQRPLPVLLAPGPRGAAAARRWWLVVGRLGCCGADGRCCCLRGPGRAGAVGADRPRRHRRPAVVVHADQRHHRHPRAGHRAGERPAGGARRPAGGPRPGARGRRAGRRRRGPAAGTTPARGAAGPRRPRGGRLRRAGRGPVVAAAALPARRGRRVGAAGRRRRPGARAPSGCRPGSGGSPWSRWWSPRRRASRSCARRGRPSWPTTAPSTPCCTTRGFTAALSTCGPLVVATAYLVPHVQYALPGVPVVLAPARGLYLGPSRTAATSIGGGAAGVDRVFDPPPPGATPVLQTRHWRVLADCAR